MGYRKDKIIRECNAFQISMSDSLGKIQIKKFFFLAKCNRLVWRIHIVDIDHFIELVKITLIGSFYIFRHSGKSCGTNATH